MKALLQKVPYKWRRAIYGFAAALTAGLFVFGVASPEQFSAQVDLWVKVIGDLVLLFSTIMALANVTPPEE